MSTLLDFFQGADRKLGVFYPNHYLIAIFRDPPAAAHAGTALIDSYFASSDVAWADGEEVIEADRQKTSLAGLAMQAVSRFFSTEQLFSDQDLEQARGGAGFLIVRCATDKAKDDAWSIIAPESPLAARYYSRAGIEHLAGDLLTD